MDWLELIDDNCQAIQIAKNVSLRLLRPFCITPQQIITRRLTPHNFFKMLRPACRLNYGVRYCQGNEKFEELGYYLFGVSSPGELL
jgi:hypothetical protein